MRHKRNIYRGFGKISEQAEPIVFFMQNDWLRVVFFRSNSETGFVTKKNVEIKKRTTGDVALILKESYIYFHL